MSKRVVLLLFMFGTVPLLILGLIFFLSFFNIQKNNITQLHQELSQRISSQISAKLKKLEGQVQLIGKIPIFDVDHVQEMEQAAMTLLDESLEYDTITVIDQNGIERLKVSRYYTFRPFELKTHKKDPNLLKTLDGQISYGPVTISKFSKFPTITLNAPILDKAGRINGTLAVGLNISKIWQLISAQQLGKNRYAYITDANGVLIAYEEISSVLQKKDLRHIKGVNDFISKKTEEQIYDGLEDLPVIGSHAVVDPTGWGIFVETPVKIAFKNFYILSGTILLLTFITIFAAIFFGYRFSMKTIVQPIRLLQKEADNIAKGNSKGSLPTGEDELGQLAASFNQMVNDLGKTTVSRDILIQEADERKRAQKRLRDSEEKLRNIVENSTNLFYSHTIHHQLLYVSPQSRELLQCEPEEAMVRWTQFVEDTPVNRAGFKITEKAILTGERQPPYELEITGLKGGKKIVEVREAPILENGSTIAIVGSLTDITDRKQAEEENALLQSQLIHAQKMKSIGTLSGGVAHEFNNILSIILGNAEFGLDDISQNHPIHELLSDIKEASLRGRDVVRQLLHFSRKSSQKKKPLDLGMVVEDSVRFLRASTPANIRFLAHYENHCPPVAGNQTQIHQLIINLCNNAAHAMKEKGGLLEIRVETKQVRERLIFADQILPPGEYVILTLSDTGEGIPHEIIDNIFDPFFTTKDIDKGSGMGLAVVYGIIKEHRGFIMMESRIGKGTLVKCYFPPTRTLSPPKSEAVHEALQGTEHILVLDDEVSIATMTGNILRKLGYTVDIKTDPVDAFVTFQSKPGRFDLVITDMTMPNMTGTSFVQKIRTVKKEIPVIICTGHSPLIDEKKAAKLQIDDLLAKPVEKDILARVVRKVLDKSK